jgi:hypothetical protein
MIGILVYAHHAMQTLRFHPVFHGCPTSMKSKILSRNSKHFYSCPGPIVYLRSIIR